MNLHLTRNARIWWSRGLIASLLFLQLASAAYACAMPSAAAGGGSMADMPCAQAMAHGGLLAMDAEQPGLCLEHCKGGSQTLEPGSAAGVVAPALVALFVIAAADEPPSDQASAWLAQERNRDGAPPLPHAILHCCFRI